MDINRNSLRRSRPMIPSVENENRKTASSVKLTQKLREEIQAGRYAPGEAARLQYAIDHEFGGMIFYAYAYRQNRELIREVAKRMPLVLIDRMLTGIDVDFVGIDNRQAMFEATRHVIELGHTRLAYVTRN